MTAEEKTSNYFYTLQTEGGDLSTHYLFLALLFFILCFIYNKILGHLESRELQN